jgi:tetratricopeptide (TPR) repeat protein
MTRRTLAIVFGAALFALAAIVWLDRARGPRVVAEGEPLPFGEKVEMRFHEAQSGESETWKLEKRETTREQSVGAVELPEPDPAPPDRAPDESARALDGLGIAAWRQGDVAKAAEQLEQAVAADPDDRVPRSHLGRLLTVMTDYERALPHLERAAALAPDDPQVWLDLRSLYERTQRLEPAFAARARAEALANGRPIVQDWAGFWTLEGAETIP